MPKIRATTIEEHKEWTRSEILQWAEKLFAAQGYGKTSLGEIADAVGIGRTTLYEYYPNKDHLVLGLLESVIPPQISPFLDDLPSEPMFERLRVMVTRIVSGVGAAPELATLVFRVGRKLPTPMQDKMWRLLDPIVEDIATTCARGVASGEFAEGDPELIARAVADLFLGAADEVLRKDTPAERARQVIDQYVPFLERALGSGSGSH